MLALAKDKSFVMNRLRLSVLGLLVLAISNAIGCSLCCSPYTDDYVTFGSRTPRFDRKHGRVGSILSDHMAGTDYVEPSGNELEYVDEASETVLLDDEGISLGLPRSDR